MTLTADDLNDLDEKIVEYLATGGASVADTLYACGRCRHVPKWVSSRFTRLAEHEHIRDLYDTGVYELADDPRESSDIK